MRYSRLLVKAPESTQHPMLTVQRKQLILARLARDGQLVAKAFSEELGISEDTVRRDLRELALEGRLQRVPGGALPASAAVGDKAAPPRRRWRATCRPRCARAS